MEKQQEKKVLGIIATVLGVIALLLSWMPIVNNFAAVLAFIGFILGIIALIVNRKNKKTLAIVGTVLSIISFIIVLATQSMYTNAIDDAFGTSDKQTTSKSKHVDEPKTFNLDETATQKDGMEIKVNSVDFNTGGEYNTPKEGTQFVVVNLTLTNNGKKSLDYNPYDFKLDDNGNQTDFSSYLGTDNNGNDLVTDELNSGTLAPGASVSGTIVGEAIPGDDLKLTSLNYDNKVNWNINLQ